MNNACLRHEETKNAAQFQQLIILSCKLIYQNKLRSKCLHQICRQKHAHKHRWSHIPFIHHFIILFCDLLVIFLHSIQQAYSIAHMQISLKPVFTVLLLFKKILTDTIPVQKQSKKRFCHTRFFTFCHVV